MDFGGKIPIFFVNFSINKILKLFGEKVKKNRSIFKSISILCPNEYLFDSSFSFSFFP